MFALAQLSRLQEESHRLEKVLESIGEGVPCPNAANLPVGDVKCSDTDCVTCWRQALETVVTSDEEHPDGPLCRALLR